MKKKALAAGHQNHVARTGEPLAANDRIQTEAQTAQKTRKRRKWKRERIERAFWHGTQMVIEWLKIRRV